MRCCDIGNETNNTCVVLMHNCIPSICLLITYDPHGGRLGSLIIADGHHQSHSSPSLGLIHLSLIQYKADNNIIRTVTGSSSGNETNNMCVVLMHNCIPSICLLTYNPHGGRLGSLIIADGHHLTHSTPSTGLIHLSLIQYKGGQ